MGAHYGTRTRQTKPNNRADGEGEQNSYTLDQGLLKLVKASITFVNSSTEQAQAANGTFVNFAVGDQVEFLGSVLNNGLFTVAAIDSVNRSFLQLYEGVKNEGPITVTCRTP